MSSDPRHQSMSRAVDFKIVYANSTAFQFNGAEAIIHFGILNDLGDASKGMEAQVAVAMGVANLKGLAYAIDAIIKNHEKNIGQEIPLNPELIKAVQGAIVSAESKLKKN